MHARAGSHDSRPCSLKNSHTADTGITTKSYFFQTQRGIIAMSTETELYIPDSESDFTFAGMVIKTFLNPKPAFSMANASSRTNSNCVRKSKIKQAFSWLHLRASNDVWT